MFRKYGRQLCVTQDYIGIWYKFCAIIIEFLQTEVLQIYYYRNFLESYHSCYNSCIQSSAGMYEKPRCMAKDVKESQQSSMRLANNPPWDCSDRPDRQIH